MLITLHHQIAKFLSKYQCAGLLLLRLTLSIIFIQTGWGKLTHLDVTTQYFTQLGIPFAHLNALFASAVEFLGGIALLIGLLVRPAALGLIGVMVVAIATAKWTEITDLNSFVGLQEWDYILMLTILLLFGAGKISLEHFVLKDKNNA